MVMASGSEHHAADERCAGCGRPCLPWYTTCPHCERPVGDGAFRELEFQVAAPLGPAEEWIDIGVSSSEPVKAALLRHFLFDNGFEFEESRRFFSVPQRHAGRLEQAIRVWAFRQDLPDDERHLDTLPSTLREIGQVTLDAIAAAGASVGTPDPRGHRARHDPFDDGGDELDLR
jgi:hypothetical protein